MKRASLFLLVLAAYLPATICAQVQTGTPAFGTYGGGPDVINLANLNSEITIPVVSKAGRGIPLTFNLTQDSSVWYPLKSGSTTAWEPVANWGWNQSIATVGSLTFNVGESGHVVNCGDYYSEDSWITYSGWAYTDGFHAIHPFSIVTTAVLNGCTNQWTYSSGQGSATDGSNYYLSVTNGDHLSELLGPDGSHINPATGSGSLEDRNGNYITLSNGVIKDTLGQTALTIGGAGTPSSPFTFTYTAPSGANAVYTEKYTSQTVQTNFGCVLPPASAHEIIRHLGLPASELLNPKMYRVEARREP